MVKCCDSSISPKDCVAQLRVKGALISVLEEFAASTFLTKGLGGGVGEMETEVSCTVLLTVYWKGTWC